MMVRCKTKYPFSALKIILLRNEFFLGLRNELSSVIGLYYVKNVRWVSYKLER